MGIIPIVGILSPYIALFAIRNGNIGSNVFPKLKSLIGFNNIPAFRRYTQFILYCFSKTFASNRDAFRPLSLPVVITIRQ